MLGQFLAMPRLTLEWGNSRSESYIDIKEAMRLTDEEMAQQVLRFLWAVVRRDELARLARHGDAGLRIDA